MFGKNDWDQIDNEYFKVIEASMYHITLKSNTTGHIWDIYCRYYPGGRSIIVYHKHRDSDPFHKQKGYHPQTIAQAQDLIKDHDRYVMEGKNK